MEIQRNLYLNRLINRKHNGLIKVITGIRRYYIQSALTMPTDAKIFQEERPLLQVGDSFKKIILIGDNIHTIRQNEQGIITMGVRDFLLNSNSLEA